MQFKPVGGSDAHDAMVIQVGKISLFEVVQNTLSLEEIREIHGKQETPGLIFGDFESGKHEVDCRVRGIFVNIQENDVFGYQNLPDWLIIISLKVSP